MFILLILFANYFLTNNERLLKLFEGQEDDLYNICQDRGHWRRIRKAQVISQACLGCICQLRTGCNTTIGCFGTVCGPFAITWRYWSSAGKPTLNNEELNVNSYSHCVNDPYCAARAVENYMSKFGHDCNGDGVVDCEDYGRIHQFGPTGCTTGTLDTKYENTFKLCLQIFQNP